jgi:hypothetical protein
MVNISYLKLCACRWYSTMGTTRVVKVKLNNVETTEPDPVKFIKGKNRPIKVKTKNTTLSEQF